MQTPMTSTTPKDFDAVLCRQCGDPIQNLGYDASSQAVRDLISVMGNPVCDTCNEKNIAAEDARRVADRLRRWTELCPPLYLDTDPARLPQDKLKRVLAWQFAPRGLVLHGETRKGKSRCAWLLIRRLILEGVSVEAMTSDQFARDCAEAHGSSAETANEWFSRLAGRPILFIDDLGKFKLTERVEAELFGIFDYRCTHLRPTIFTTNAVGQVLAARMTPDRGAPFIARIREFCEPISF
jgi:DNA replication protein DnaC